MGTQDCIFSCVFFLPTDTDQTDFSARCALPVANVDFAGVDWDCMRIVVASVREMSDTQNSGGLMRNYGSLPDGMKFFV